MSDKIRIHEVAKELGIKPKEVVDKALDMGLSVKTASSSIALEDAQTLMNFIMTGTMPGAASKPETKKKPTVVKKSEKSEPKVSPEKSEEAQKPVATEKESPKESVVPTTQNEQKSEVQKSEVQNASSQEAKAEVKPDRIKKKKGLTIVKKRRPAPVEQAPRESARSFEKNLSDLSDAELAGNYGKLSQEAIEERQNRKAKKSHHMAHKQDHGKEIDLGRGFSDFKEVIEEDQVELLDFRDEEAKREIAKKLEEERQREKQRVKENSKNVVRSGAIAGQFGTRTNSIKRGKRKGRVKKKIEEDIVVSSIEIPEDVRVYEFAEKIGKSIGEVVKVLFGLGMMVTKNDYLDKDAIEILSEEFEVEIHTIDPKSQFDYTAHYDDEHEEDTLQERPPVITIMGHVDHGKTSLLDKIRDSKVADRESGGITQHIGAYSITHNDKLITFLDTPGHAAFSQMRARGAEVTDIIIIVVAADDGVKPQTKEAIEHAKEANVPIIVAVNKVDKPDANVDMVKSQMAEVGMTPTDWGGDYDFVEVSAKTGLGIDNLLEDILLQAELLELRGDPTRKAKAAVVESSLEKGRGAVATVIVQNGTLRVGDTIVAGSAYGRVKAILDDNKNQIKELGLSETGVVIGLSAVPDSGETLVATQNEKEAREYANQRHEYDRHKELSVSTKASLDDLTTMIAEGQLKALKVILKADVHGSLEAIKNSLENLRNEEVKVSFVTTGVGGITENDVHLASNTENCVILGFNVRPTGSVKASAKQSGIDIRTYSVIYEMIDDITGILTGMMKPVIREENSGQAEVREVFKIPKVGSIAGCMVSDGKIIRGGKARLIREGVVLNTTTIATLKRFKDEVKEVGKGYECGIMLDNVDSIEVGDVIETFIEIEEKAKL